MDIYLDFNTEGEFLVTPTGPVLKFPGFVSDEEAPTGIRVNIGTQSFRLSVEQAEGLRDGLKGAIQVMEHFS